MCVSLFYVIDTGSIGSRARYEMGVAYLPSVFFVPVSFDDYFCHCLRLAFPNLFGSKKMFELIVKTQSLVSAANNLGCGGEHCPTQWGVNASQPR